MDSLCDTADYWGETFKDGSNVTFAQFSECVHNDVYWVERAWLWISAPVYIWYLFRCRHNGGPLPISWLYNVKLAITVLQLAICTAELTARADLVDRRAAESYLQPYILGPIVEAGTLLLVMFLVEAERRCGRITSSVLFIYWLLANLTHVIPLYFMFSQSDYDPDTSEFDLFRTQYVLSLAQLVSCSFAEKLPPVEGKKPCPEYRCSFLSQLTFTWINGLMALGYQRPLTEKDMFHMNERDQSKVVVPKFEAKWKQEETKLNDNTARMSKTSTTTHQESKPLLTDSKCADTDSEGSVTTSVTTKRSGVSLVKVIFLTFGLDFLFGHSWRLVWMFLEFSHPFLLGKFIEVAEDTDTSSWKGYLLCFAFLGNLLIQTAVINKLINEFCALGYRIRPALVSAVYKKALTMNNKARAKSTVGEIVNIMSVDVEHIRHSCIWISWELWATPAKILISMTMLYYRVGWAMLSGVAVVLVMMPINAFISKKIRGLEKEHKELKDKRIKLMTEVLNGVKILKLYAWDMAFADKVTSIRNEELGTKLKQLSLDAVSSFAWSITPFGVGLSTFVTYVFMSENHLMDAQTALVSLCLFGKLAGTLNFIPHLVMEVTKAKVSLDRIEEFLHNEDIDSTNVTRESSDDAVSITDGDFIWDSALGTCLKEHSIFTIAAMYLSCAFIFMDHLRGIMLNGKVVAETDEGNPRVPDRSQWSFLAATVRINLSVPKGSLIAVVGTVGSGKSSLISAILGEMQKLKGRVNVSGRIAYVPQQAWIQNATLRDNILFGHPLNSNKYRQIIDSCSLTSDLEVLQAKDMTEIGEKGINLSGGQKQRVSLARAVYFNSDIYLLDDPLSAVDSHVGKHIFENVIGPDGLLRNKTRILVTHGIKWLPAVDRIVVISGGTISEVGTYTELMEHDGAFAKFMTTYLTNSGESDSSDSDEDVKEFKKKTVERLQSLHSQDSRENPDADTLEDKDDCNLQRQHVDHSDRDYATIRRIKKAYKKRSNSDYNIPVLKYRTRTISRSVSCEEQIEYAQVDSLANKPTLLRSISTHKHDETFVEEINNNDVKILQEEEIETGEIRSAVIVSYISALGTRLTMFLFCLYALHHSFEVWSGTWLTTWTSDSDLTNLTTLPADSDERQDLNVYYLKVYAGLGIAQAFMSLVSMMISSRVNIRAAEKLHRNMLINILRCPSSFFDTNPVGRIVNRFSGDIDTVDSSLPHEVKHFFVCLMTFFTSLCVILYTTPQFAILIIPVGVLYYFIQRNLLPTKRQLRRLEQKTRSPIYNNFSESLNGVGVIRAYEVQERFANETHERVDRNQECAFSNMILDRWLGVRLDSMGALMVFTTAVFAMYNREQIGGALVGLALNYALEVDGKMNWFLHLVAALQHSFVNVERIEQYTTKPTEAALTTDHEPSPEWPGNGRVELKSYSVRYREGLDLVLKNIDLSVKPGEKIGIVGRTGAGKSSLTLSLFRLLEPAAGSITIDGEDVCGLGLHDLRSRLTILPQDPVLFSGTLRMNLDPMDKHTDETIYTALGHAHLKSFVESLPGKLAYECGEGGQNLSVGQRQLICLARSLLKKSKVLVLDEATAAVDMETDDLIQQTIRSEFKDSTVLTIAHRLNTVMDYDRILVLGQGEVKEFDTPKALLSNTQSVFYGLAKDAGLVK